jgi:hypothetical protein
MVPNETKIEYGTTETDSKNDKLTKTIYHSNLEVDKMIGVYRLGIIAAIAYLYYIHYLECI